MNFKIFIAAFLGLLFATCNNVRTQEKPSPEMPKALEDKNSSYEFVSKRSGYDLVEQLYKELVNKDVDLKTLEEKIDDLTRSRSDSTKLFDKFNKKNQSYYSSVKRHISEIKDSLLRDKMSDLVATNLSRYNSSISRHTRLLSLIESKKLTINDLHNILKIVSTLPLMEKYQRENLPNTKPIEGYIKEQDEGIKLADTLTKK